MSLRDILDSLGLQAPDIVAGFAGGVVNAFVLRKVNPYEAISSVVVGALTAGYLSDLARHITSLDGGGVAFVVGLTAMALCQGLFEAARKIRIRIPGVTQEPPDEPRS